MEALEWGSRSSTPVSMQLSAMGTQQSVMSALQASTEVMGKVNADMKVADIQKMIKEFSKESMKAEMNQEMIGDAMEMAHGD